MSTHLATLALLTASAGLWALGLDDEAFISDLMAGMDRSEKLGQMMMVMESEIDPQTAADNHLGALLLGPGRSFRPGLETGDVARGWADRYDAYQVAVGAARHGIPLMTAVDAVHGHALAVGATVLPHNIGLAATSSPALMRELGYLVGREVLATGVDAVLGPCVAINRDIRWGRSYEGWSDHPFPVAGSIQAFIEGLQDPSPGPDRIIACAKHFIADGGAVWGTGPRGGIDQGNVTDDLETLRRLHLPPYLEAIEAGVGMIMVSYGKWHGVEMHHSRPLLHDLLKQELGFDGIVISDYGGFIDSSDPSVDTMQKAAPSALLAGIDMFMVGSNWTEFKPAMVAALEAGTISEADLDHAVRRILRVKLRHGLWDRPLANRSMTEAGLLGHPDHRRVARTAVHRSAVLLKNAQDILPLPRDARVLVAGEKAADMGVLCGGWTVEWAGLQAPLANALIPGTHILDGVRALVEPSGGRVFHSPSGMLPSEPVDLVIAVFGENPFAEWQGDNAQLSINPIEQAMLRTVEGHGIPVIAIIIASRPLFITDRIDLWAAAVMGWLPGSEGGLGLAELLFGEAAFTGRLPVSWPRRPAHMPQNFDLPRDPPLFTRGFGLDTLADPPLQPLRRLPGASPGVAYQFNLASSSASGLPLHFEVVEGTLPDGVELSPTGTLSGTPTAASTHSFVVRAGAPESMDHFQSFTLNTVEGMTYESWAAAIDWPDPSSTTSDPGSDPDGDGLSNWMEYFLGSDPLLSDPERGPRIRLSGIAASRRAHYQFTQRTSHPLTDFVLESSPDFLGWTPITAPPIALGGGETYRLLEVETTFALAQPFWVRIRLLWE